MVGPADRLLGWWSIDEGSSEERARLYCAGGSWYVFYARQCLSAGFFSFIYSFQRHNILWRFQGYVYQVFAFLLPLRLEMNLLKLHLTYLELHHIHRHTLYLSYIVGHAHTSRDTGRYGAEMCKKNGEKFHL